MLFGHFGAILEPLPPPTDIWGNPHRPTALPRLTEQLKRSNCRLEQRGSAVTAPTYDFCYGFAQGGFLFLIPRHGLRHHNTSGLFLNPCWPLPESLRTVNASPAHPKAWPRSTPTITEACFSSCLWRGMEGRGAVSLRSSFMTV